MSSTTNNVDSPQGDRPHHVVVVGGSYAGLSAIVHLLALADGRKLPTGDNPLTGLDVRLRRRLDLTLIDERDGFFHTVGAPLAHTTRVFAEPFWKPYSELPILVRPDLSIRQGSVTSVDYENQVVTFTDATTAGGNACDLRFDFLVLATGLRRDWPGVPKAFGTAEYVRDALELITQIENSKELPIVVIGGGAVGIEFAGEIAANHPSNPVKLIHSRGELLSSEPLPEIFKTSTLRILREHGVDVILNERPRVDYSGDLPKLIFSSDREPITAGVVIMSISSAKPVTGFVPSDAVNPEGYVNVDTKLNIVSPSTAKASRVFAIGDIADNQSVKRAGSAFATGKISAVNIYSQLLAVEDEKRTAELAEFPAVPPMMALAVGREAVAFGPGFDTKSGVDMMEWMFQDDLGWKSTLKHLGLTGEEEKEDEEAKKKEEESAKAAKVEEAKKDEIADLKVQELSVSSETTVAA